MAAASSSALRAEPLRHAEALPAQFREYLKNMLTALQTGRVREALTLYEKGRRDMNSRFFSESNWPEAAVVQEVLKVDDGFRCLYETLWFKHATVTLPQRNEVTRLRLLIDSYAVYTRIIREFMDESSPLRQYTLPPDWVYDIVNEFVYLFTSFVELRAKRYRRTQRATTPAGESTAEAAAVDAAMGSVWSARSVLALLREVVRTSGINETLRAARASAASAPTTAAGGAVGAAPASESSSTPAAAAASEVPLLAGAFALVCLVRLEAKLGDYAAAIEAASAVTTHFDGPLSRVQRCHLSLHSYLGFALAMSRRYADAARTLSRILLVVHRASHLLAESSQASRYMKTMADKMLALVALCEALSPGAPIDELVRQKAHERFRERIEAIAAGGKEAEDAVGELFDIASPSFVDASWPPAADDTPVATASSSSDSDTKITSAGTLADVGAGDGDDGQGDSSGALSIARVQRRVFMREACARVEHNASLRAFLRLYTSIDVPKLATLAECSSDRARAGLATLKLLSLQLRGAEDAPAASGTLVSVDPVHFFIDDSMVEVSETRTTRDDTRQFLRFIGDLARVRRQVGSVTE